jgi:Xaa-Pro aminopeptidase
LRNGIEDKAKPIRVSDAELKRRWKAVRERMKEQGLDFLIFQNSSPVLPGNVKWFTDISFKGFVQPVTVIFPRDEEMTIIKRALRPAREEAPSPELRGVKKQIMVPMFWTSLTPGITFDAEKIVVELSKYKKCRIGWVGLGYIPAAFYKYVTEHLSSAKFEDATDMIDYLKAIKSDEEIKLIRETCELEDKIFEYVQTLVHPGESNAVIKSKIIGKCTQWGAEANIDIRTAPAGTAPKPPPNNPPRILQNGDQLTFLIETSSPTDYWGELSRTICIGKVTAQLEEQFELAKEAQQATLNLLRPGASVAKFWEVNNAFMRKHGYPEENRLYAHGQGYDMVERPCLDPDEPWKIESRMFLAVHPEVKSDQAFGWVCDNYLVKDSGKPEHFHKTPQKIFVV